MNQDTYGDFLRYQESPGMAFDTTRRHKTKFQEVDFLKIIKILSEMLPRAHMYTQNWNLGWTRLESTSKIMRVRIENASFGYILMFEIWISEGLALLLEDLLILK